MRHVRELRDRGHRRGQIEVAGELRRGGVRIDGRLVLALRLEHPAQDQLELRLLHRRQRRRVRPEGLDALGRPVDLVELDLDLRGDELRGDVAGRLGQRLRDLLGRDLGLAIAQIGLGEAGHRGDVLGIDRERLAEPLARGIEPAAVERTLAGQHPRLHDRARIGAGEVLVLDREDREEVGLLLLRLRLRERRGEPDLRRDVVLLDREDLVEVRARAFDVGERELRARAAIEAEDLERGSVRDRLIERLGRRRRIVRRGLRPAEIEREGPVLGSLRQHGLELRHRLVGRGGHRREGLRAIQRGPGDTVGQRVADQLASVVEPRRLVLAIREGTRERGLGRDAERLGVGVVELDDLLRRGRRARPVGRVLGDE